MGDSAGSRIWTRLRSARALAAAFLCCVALVVAGCGGDDDGDTTATGGETATEATGGSTAAVDAAKVDIADFKYAPVDVTVKAGGTVTWTNSDAARHTASGQPLGQGFDTGTLSQGASKEVAFEQAGTFEYVCLFHQFMTGTVTVVQ